MKCVKQLLKSSPLAALEARILLAYALNWPRTALITRANDFLPNFLVDRFLELQAQRVIGKPIAQLVGSREFFGLDFNVTPHVLIPRPETELLVECALAAVHKIRFPRILDLGTGSGAIAIAIAHARPDARIIATDYCTYALDVARQNARRLLGDAALMQPLPTLVPNHNSSSDGLTHPHFILRHGDWFNALDKAYQAVPAQFDVIVSNPPYIRVSDPHLCEGDLRFEPLYALTDYANGLSAIHTIISGSVIWLSPGGKIWIEHGHNQAKTVRSMFYTYGLDSIRSIRDLAGIERVTGGAVRKS
ncbi:peptide chain release factor N(5)-glutamine methyltransferase [Candidatus Vallotia tarda]|uniref:Release factor glutamine methyltransferase n=1 Tax=Candidatus Vallotiella hemipterorum TaxID=1177213 RepID=A0A916NM13_9BURK|nr:peptide chain release factor N(5)-glutamine methyltransferase [Candidatus Vallotia tarda]CAG7603176.1 Release factor glutamine methyltransferase [Candidatus Vallotia tarda]